MVARFGAGMVVSEMIASRDLATSHRSLRSAARMRAELDGDGAPTAVQLAGREAYWMGEAARVVAGAGAQVIDINMGCPAKKVTTGYSGAALMRNLDHALTLVDAVVSAVDVPVTLKMRLGWDRDQMNAPDLARRAVDGGIARITVHGRTRCQFYKGRADWAAIRAVREAVSVPVVANGDVVDAPTARTAMDQSGTDAVMIGRGAQGQPWAVAQIEAALEGRPAVETPRGADLVAVVRAHYEDMLRFYGRDLGRRCARKHLGWYCDAAGAPQALRRDLLTTEEPASVLRKLSDLGDLNMEVAA